MAVPGTAGKILVVDLATESTRFEQPSDEVYLKYLGGYGLAAYYLYTMQKPGADPLAPENTLGFFTGMLTGTAPSALRQSVMPAPIARIFRPFRSSRVRMGLSLVIR